LDLASAGAAVVCRRIDERGVVIVVGVGVVVVVGRRR
jgi:hypothetical protein